jgi:hypothetical protein
MDGRSASGADGLSEYDKLVSDYAWVEGIMSPALAACAACGHVLADDEALDPCPKCGAKERTLIRDTLVVERPDPERVVKAHRIEQRQPDGSSELVETYEDELGPEKEHS